MNTITYANFNKKKVLIIGGYGVGNIGDEAILSGLLKTISCGDLTVFSSNPSETKSYHNVHSEKTNLKSFLSCDDVIIGGGELFQDGMAWKFSLASIFAKLLGKNVKVMGIGVDVKKPVEKLLTSLSLKFVDKITVRDERSLKNLVNMGLNPCKVNVVKDFVFNLVPHPTVDSELFLSKHNLESGNFIVLVLRSTSSVTDKLLLNFFEKFIVDLAHQKLSLKIVVIPFSNHPNSCKDDDMIIIQTLKKRLENDFLIIFNGQPDPSGVMYVISKASLVITTRLHPLIFSELTKLNSVCPKAIAIPLFPKIRSFATKYGYPIVELENLEKIYELVNLQN